jgi:hypothetical protein
MIYTCVHYAEQTEEHTLVLFGVETTWKGCASCEAILYNAGFFRDESVEVSK